jgi:hypothetical protein
MVKTPSSRCSYSTLPQSRKSATGARKQTLGCVDPSEQEQLLASLKFGRDGIQDGAA